MDGRTDTPLGLCIHFIYFMQTFHSKGFLELLNVHLLLMEYPVVIYCKLILEVELSL